MFKTRLLALLLAGIVLLVSGCESDSYYTGLMETTTILIQGSASACVSMAKANEMNARAEA